MTHTRRVIGMLAMAVTLAVAASGPAHADTANASGDAHINASQPMGNFGSAGNVTVGVNFRGLLQFDLGPVGRQEISRATLRVFVRTVAKPGTLEVHKITSPWTEATVTNTGAPSIDATVLGTINVTAASEMTYVNVDVTPLGEAWLGGLTPNFGLALVGTGSTKAEIDSKETTGTSHPAELEVIPAGASGPPGPAGESVIGMSLAPGDASCPWGGAMFTVGGSTSYACNGKPGADGLQGEQGPAGPAGSAGEPGAQGPAGPEGAAGAEGPAGPEGPTGATGPAGPAGGHGPVYHRAVSGTEISGEPQSYDSLPADGSLEEVLRVDDLPMFKWYLATATVSCVQCVCLLRRNSDSATLASGTLASEPGVVGTITLMSPVHTMANTGFHIDCAGPEGLVGDRAIAFIEVDSVIALH